MPYNNASSKVLELSDIILRGYEIADSNTQFSKQEICFPNHKYVPQIIFGYKKIAPIGNILTSLSMKGKTDEIMSVVEQIDGRLVAYYNGFDINTLSDVTVEKMLSEKKNNSAEIDGLKLYFKRNNNHIVKIARSEQSTYEKSSQKTIPIQINEPYFKKNKLAAELIRRADLIKITDYYYLLNDKRNDLCSDSFFAIRQKKEPYTFFWKFSSINSAGNATLSNERSDMFKSIYNTIKSEITQNCQGQPEVRGESK